MADHEPSSPDPEDRPPEDPLAALFGGQVPDEFRDALQSMGIGDIDPSMLRMVQAQVAAMMSGSDEGPINHTLATETARQVVASHGDQSIGTRTAQHVQQVVQVANLWLDAVTDLPPAAGPVLALSRAEWVERTMPLWRRVTEPVAAGVSDAMTRAMTQQLGQLGVDEVAAVPGLPPEIGRAHV